MFRAAALAVILAMLFAPVAHQLEVNFIRIAVVQYMGEANYLLPITKKVSSSLEYGKVYVMDANSSQPLYSSLISTAPPVVLVFDNDLRSKTLLVAYDMDQNPYQGYYVHFTSPRFLFYDEFTDASGWHISGDYTEYVSALLLHNARATKLINGVGDRAAFLFLIGSQGSFDFTIILRYDNNVTYTIRKEANGISAALSYGSNNFHGHISIDMQTPLLIAAGAMVRHQSVTGYLVAISTYQTGTEIGGQMRSMELSIGYNGTAKAMATNVTIVGQNIYLDRILAFDGLGLYYTTTGTVGSSPIMYGIEVGSSIRRVVVRPGHSLLISMRNVLGSIQEIQYRCLNDWEKGEIIFEQMKGYKVRMSGIQNIFFTIDTSTFCVPVQLDGFTAFVVIDRVDKEVSIVLEQYVPAAEVQVPSLEPSGMVAGGILTPFQSLVLAILATLFIIMWRVTDKMWASLGVSSAVAFAVSMPLIPYDSSVMNLVPILIMFSILSIILEYRSRHL